MIYSNDASVGYMIITGLVERRGMLKKLYTLSMIR